MSDVSNPTTASSGWRMGTVCALSAAVLAGSLTPGLTRPAQATTAGSTALKVAAAQKGDPYKWGASGPNSFDCSGLIQYAFRKARKKLPRTAAQQYRASHHLRKSSRKPGDLVFFNSRNGIYHVGVYAGGNRMWHAPKPGATVRLEKIWTSSTKYGRVG